MNSITRKTATISLLLLLFTTSVIAQQKRQPPPKPQPQPRATPAPTFETLVPANAYTLYGEVRGVGQLIKSSAINDLLDPILKLSGPPKEFKTVVKWLNAHAEEVMTSRMLLGTWPTVNAKQAPQLLIAIEFSSPEEATKFAGTLNDFLPTVIPSPTASEPNSKEAEEKPKPTGPPDPGFHLQRLGSLVVITPKPWTMKQLKPAGSKLLTEDVNFRAARNRFTTEPIFFYLDTTAIGREEEERQKHYEEQRRLEEEQMKRQQAETEAKGEKPEENEPEPDEEEKPDEATAKLGVAVAAPDEGKEPPGPDPLSMALSAIGSAFFQGEPHMPEGVAFALSFEGDSFDLRALLVNQTGDKTDAIPFVPLLITGPALSPESPNIFPADTELLATMSLDLPQIYAALSKPVSRQVFIRSHGSVLQGKAEAEPESPFAAIEQRLKIKLKDDLLPLFGSEISISLPANNASSLGLPVFIPGMPPQRQEKEGANAAPIVAIAVKDKEGLRTLMPKLIDNLGFKGASSLMQTERREDTELISVGNVFAYAFVGNFIVLSPDATATRRVVDSYLKHETLAGDIQFRNSTRWQPRPLQGQLYISQALMEGFKAVAQQPSANVSEQVRAFLMRASTVPQPLTYSLSNEGFGPLHEVHIPKSLILMAVAGISGEVNPPPMVQNEQMAVGMMYTIAYGENEFKKKNGSFGSLEELIAAGTVPKELMEKSSYRFEVTVAGDKFEVTAVPVEYGKSGNRSFFLDNTQVLRGRDKSGATALSSDPPIN